MDGIAPLGSASLDASIDSVESSGSQRLRSGSGTPRGVLKSPNVPRRRKYRNQRMVKFNETDDITSVISMDELEKALQREIQRISDSSFDRSSSLDNSSTANGRGVACSAVDPSTPLTRSANTVSCPSTASDRSEGIGGSQLKPPLPPDSPSPSSTSPGALGGRGKSLNSSIKNDDKNIISEVAISPISTSPVVSSRRRKGLNSSGRKTYDDEGDDDQSVTPAKEIKTGSDPEPSGKSPSASAGQTETKGEVSPSGQQLSPISTSPVVSSCRRKGLNSSGRKTYDDEGDGESVSVDVVQQLEDREELLFDQNVCSSLQRTGANTQDEKQEIYLVKEESNTSKDDRLDASEKPIEDLSNVAVKTPAHLEDNGISGDEKRSTGSTLTSIETDRRRSNIQPTGTAAASATAAANAASASKSDAQKFLERLKMKREAQNQTSPPSQISPPLSSKPYGAAVSDNVPDFLSFSSRDNSADEVRKAVHHYSNQKFSIPQAHRPSRDLVVDASNEYGNLPQPQKSFGSEAANLEGSNIQDSSPRGAASVFDRWLVEEPVQPEARVWKKSHSKVRSRPALAIDTTIEGQSQGSSLLRKRNSVTNRSMSSILTGDYAEVFNCQRMRSSLLNATGAHDTEDEGPPSPASSTTSGSSRHSSSRLEKTVGSSSKGIRRKGSKLFSLLPSSRKKAATVITFSLREELIRIKDTWVTGAINAGDPLPKAAIQELDKRISKSGSRREKPKLSLSGCGLDDEQVKILITALAERPVVEKLELSNNSISTESVRLIRDLQGCQLQLAASLDPMNRMNAIFLADVEVDRSKEHIEKRMIEELKLLSSSLRKTNAQNSIRKCYLDLGAPATINDMTLAEMWSEIVGRVDESKIAAAKIAMNIFPPSPEHQQRRKEAEVEKEKKKLMRRNSFALLMSSREKKESSNTPGIDYEDAEDVLLEGLRRQGTINTVHDSDARKLEMIAGQFNTKPLHYDDDANNFDYLPAPPEAKNKLILSPISEEATSSLADSPAKCAITTPIVGVDISTTNVGEEITTVHHSDHNTFSSPESMNVEPKTLIETIDDGTFPKEEPERWLEPDASVATPIPEGKRGEGTSTDEVVPVEEQSHSASTDPRIESNESVSIVTPDDRDSSSSRGREVVGEPCVSVEKGIATLARNSSTGVAAPESTTELYRAEATNDIVGTSAKEGEGKEKFGEGNFGGINAVIKLNDEVGSSTTSCERTLKVTACDSVVYTIPSLVRDGEDTQSQMGYERIQGQPDRMISDASVLSDVDLNGSVHTCEVNLFQTSTLIYAPESSTIPTAPQELHAILDIDEKFDAIDHSNITDTDPSNADGSTPLNFSDSSSDIAEAEPGISARHSTAIDVMSLPNVKVEENEAEAMVSDSESADIALALKDKYCPPIAGMKCADQQMITLSPQSEHQNETSVGFQPIASEQLAIEAEKKSVYEQLQELRKKSNGETEVGKGTESAEDLPMLENGTVMKVDKEVNPNHVNLVSKELDVEAVFTPVNSPQVSGIKYPSLKQKELEEDSGEKSKLQLTENSIVSSAQEVINDSRGYESKASSEKAIDRSFTEFLKEDTNTSMNDSSALEPLIKDTAVATIRPIIVTANEHAENECANDESQLHILEEQTINEAEATVEWGVQCKSADTGLELYNLFDDKASAHDDLRAVSDDTSDGDSRSSDTVIKEKLPLQGTSGRMRFQPRNFSEQQREMCRLSQVKSPRKPHPNALNSIAPLRTPPKDYSLPNKSRKYSASRDPQAQERAMDRLAKPKNIVRFPQTMQNQSPLKVTKNRVPKGKKMKMQKHTPASQEESVSRLSQAKPYVSMTPSLILRPSHNTTTFPAPPCVREQPSSCKSSSAEKAKVRNSQPSLLSAIKRHCDTGQAVIHLRSWTARFFRPFEYDEEGESTFEVLDFPSIGDALELKRKLVYGGDDRKFQVTPETSNSVSRSSSSSGTNSVENESWGNDAPIEQKSKRSPFVPRTTPCELTAYDNLFHRVLRRTALQSVEQRLENEEIVDAPVHSDAINLDNEMPELKNLRSVGPAMRALLHEPLNGKENVNWGHTIRTPRQPILDRRPGTSSITVSSYSIPQKPTIGTDEHINSLIAEYSADDDDKLQEIMRLFASKGDPINTSKLADENFSQAELDLPSESSHSRCDEKSVVCEESQEETSVVSSVRNSPKGESKAESPSENILLRLKRKMSSLLQKSHDVLETLQDVAASSELGLSVTQVDLNYFRNRCRRLPLKGAIKAVNEAFIDNPSSSKWATEMKRRLGDYDELFSKADELLAEYCCTGKSVMSPSRQNREKANKSRDNSTAEMISQAMSKNCFHEDFNKLLNQNCGLLSNQIEKHSQHVETIGQE